MAQRKSKNGKTDKARRLALDVLKPGGLRLTDLIDRIVEKDPILNKDTIRGDLPKFAREKDSPLVKSAGLYMLADAEEADVQSEEAPVAVSNAAFNEDVFYEPFAKWLKDDLQECTDAYPLGGNALRDKWGTPDVIGVKKFGALDIVKPPIEIISAEIKASVNVHELRTGFAQACFYCLFSHRTYLVAPKDSNEYELARLDSLGRVFGIGLVLFDHNQRENPNFTIRSRANKQEPDMVYANLYMKRIESKLIKKLFS